MLIIQKFIEMKDIKTVREYQKFKKENSSTVPSLWVINERFGSWECLLKRLDRYRWQIIQMKNYMRLFNRLF
jgi:hypothetical protein